MISEAEKGYLNLLRKDVKTPEERILMEILGSKFEQELKEEIKVLNFAIKKKNYLINDIWDLVNTNKPYPELIDLLVEHLPVKYHLRNREAIIRALAVREAKGKAANLLIKEYHNFNKDLSDLRWVIGNSVCYTATQSDLRDIISIVKEKNNGCSRQMFVRALAKFKTSEVETVLINLLSDDEVAADAIMSLAKLKSINAKGKIEELLNHSNKIIKKEAQKALNKL